MKTSYPRSTGRGSKGRALALILLAPGIVLILLSGVARAQALSADAVAARIDQHYNSLRSLEVDFTQEYEGMGMDRREAGVLLLKKPNRMRWTYSKPVGKLFVLDGHNGYFYSPGDTTAQRVPIKQLDDLRLTSATVARAYEAGEGVDRPCDCSCCRWGVHAYRSSAGDGEARGRLQRYGDGGGRDPIDAGRGDGRDSQHLRFF